MDEAALGQVAGVPHPVILAQVRSQKQTGRNTLFPVQPPVEAIGEYKVSPMVHAGYAFTWFGLSGAGIYMTRKLITRGR